MEYKVSRINPKMAYYDIKYYHYAHRIPSITFAFGLFDGQRLIGVLTIGKPASNSLCEGLLGKEHSPIVYELNRLYINEGMPRNTASYFVGEVLKSLKSQNIVIVSYADSGMNHHGYVYQATNFLYTGMTKERTDKYVEEGKHSRHYKDVGNEKRVVRSAKYRYVYFCCDKREKKRLMKCLKYPIAPYPKGENKNYVIGEQRGREIINTETSERIIEPTKTIKPKEAQWIEQSLF